MKAVVLNFKTSSVDIYDIPDNMKKDVNGWEGPDGVLDQLGCDISNCQWMIVDDDEYGIPVFYNDEQQPAYVL